MSDIVEQLRWAAIHSDQEQAIAAMERAAAEIERLRELLRPFVDMVAEPDDFAAARRALEGK